MLTRLDTAQNLVEIALNETTGIHELIADWSYLVDREGFNLALNFTHTAPHLTRTSVFKHLPGNFGFHPVDRLVEQFAFIGQLVQLPRLKTQVAQVSVILPAPDSPTGQLFQLWAAPELLKQWQVPVQVSRMDHYRFNSLDPGRVILIPLTDIQTDETALPVQRQVLNIRRQITSRVPSFFASDDTKLACQVAGAIAEVMDTTITLVGGGLIGALYFPQTGYLEFSLMNWRESAVGTTPDAHLDALIERLENSMFYHLYPHLMAGYGSILLANGVASLALLCDGAATTWLERVNLPLTSLAGFRATVVMPVAPNRTDNWENFAQERVALLRETTQAWAQRK